MKKDIQRCLERGFRSARRDVSFQRLVDIASDLFEDFDTPISLGVYLRLKYACYQEYLEMELDPNDYECADAFRTDYQCIKLFSKAEFFPRIFDTKKEAILNFIQAESDCKKTNLRFENRRTLYNESPVQSAILFGAARKISGILGRCPPLTSLSSKFGPGNNVGLADNTSIISKLSATLTLTRELVPEMPTIMENIPCWAATLSGLEECPTPVLDKVKVPYRLVPGSELGFVPKNAKTDRAICTEPLLNSFIQRGIGIHIGQRLSASGCNLRTQRRNQRLAKLGSLRNHLATVDLSAASDTVSFGIVHELLPKPWFDLLYTSRCSQFSYEGLTFPFEKFSSMGNGYTFELESLIFFALAYATCKHFGLPVKDISVFGDDIIIPSEVCTEFAEVLNFCGFKVNESKSFTRGPFRESCGSDWFLGVQVRPLFLKRRPTNASLMGWCNHIYATSNDLNDHRWKRFYDGLKKLVPRIYHRLEGPRGYGDGHFVQDNFTTVKDSRSRKGWEGKGYYTLSSTPISVSTDSPRVWPAALYGMDGRAPGESTSSSVSMNSREGLHISQIRGKTRTVLKRMYHP